MNRVTKANCVRRHSWSKYFHGAAIQKRVRSVYANSASAVSFVGFGRSEIWIRKFVFHSTPEKSNETAFENAAAYFLRLFHAEPTDTP